MAKLSPGMASPEPGLALAHATASGCNGLLPGTSASTGECFPRKSPADSCGAPVGASGHVAPAPRGVSAAPPLARWASSRRHGLPLRFIVAPTAVLSPEPPVPRLLCGRSSDELLAGLCPVLRAVPAGFVAWSRCDGRGVATGQACSAAGIGTYAEASSSGRQGAPSAGSADQSGSVAFALHPSASAGVTIARGLRSANCPGPTFWPERSPASAAALPPSLVTRVSAVSGSQVSLPPVAVSSMTGAFAGPGPARLAGTVA
mmetsp:Transcript_95440/g.269703  ORF Transcript_95440/g.269703 Transcript_95440/m.269703 type:complete len:260 (+) Transcript_95440:636-1415(+)